MKNQKRILAVDDDPAIRKVLGIRLEKEGYSVKIASSGAEALSILEDDNFSPDCILLDIRMPGMSGIDVLKTVKTEYVNIPVIMCTASSELEVGIETMKTGAFDYLTKPLRKIELIETIKKALNYREILLRNERLEKENREYQKSLEKKVEDRTRELFLAYDKLKQTNLATVKVLAETIEAKDPYTRGHCNRVRYYALKLAREAGVPEKQHEMLEYGALLHDIGKIGISELLLGKKGPLLPEERSIFQKHSLIGENILKTVEFFKPCLQIIRNHHEWFDGSGYPDQLKSDNISIVVRIVSIADSYDAMTSNRPYRNALPVEKALDSLRECRERQFDPDMVDLFIKKELFQFPEECSPYAPYSLTASSMRSTVSGETSA